MLKIFDLNHSFFVQQNILLYYLFLSNYNYNYIYYHNHFLHFLDIYLHIFHQKYNFHNLKHILLNLNFLNKYWLDMILYLVQNKLYFHLLSYINLYIHKIFHHFLFFFQYNPSHKILKEYIYYHKV